MIRRTRAELEAMPDDPYWQAKIRRLLNAEGAKRCTKTDIANLQQLPMWVVHRIVAKVDPDYKANDHRWVSKDYSKGTDDD